MVKIEIVGENASETLKDLAALAASFGGSATAPLKVADTAPAEEKKNASRSKKTETVKQPDPEPEDDAISLEAVQAKMKEILEPHKGTPSEKDFRAKIKAIFTDFGGVSTSTLKPEDFGKVLEAFDELANDLD